MCHIYRTDMSVTSRGLKYEHLYRLQSLVPGVHSASNINEYQEYFLGDEGGRCVGLYLNTFMCRLSLNLAASTSWNPHCVSRRFMRLLLQCLLRRRVNNDIWKIYLCLCTITCILCGKKFHILSRRKESTNCTDINNKRENHGVIMSNAVKWAKLPP
jgi:hypothetical protein